MTTPPRLSPRRPAAPPIAVPPSAIPAAGARRLFARSAAHGRGHGAPPLAGPAIAVLCTPQRAQAAAASIALALVHVTGRPFALAASVGVAPAAQASLTPSARRAAAHLRQRGEPAVAIGRTVWLASPPPDRDALANPDAAATHDQPLTQPDAAATHDHQPRTHPETAAAHDQPAVVPDTAAACAASADPATAVAVASAAAARAAQAVAAPAALAIPCARSAAIDRVLAWHDGIVVVREPDTTERLVDLIVASLAQLDVPVVAMPAPSRLAAHAAVAGLRPPASAIDAVTRILSAGAMR